MEKKILPAGDAALVVEFGREISDELNEQVHLLAGAMKRSPIHGVREVLPTFRSLMVCYDPGVISFAKLKKKIEHIKLDGKMAGTEMDETLLVPCCYGNEFGPDLADMSSMLGLSVEEIIRLHSTPDYKIYMLGFLPGFVYLGGLDERIHAKRLDSPRTAIPKGSVGIGGSQTGVYPIASPGGWRLIGSTPLEFYNPLREEPILCKAGERLRFVPIDQKEYELIKKDVENGTYHPEYQKKMA